MVEHATTTRLQRAPGLGPGLQQGSSRSERAMGRHRIKAGSDSGQPNHCTWWWHCERDCESLHCESPVRMAAANGTVQPVPLLALWCPPPTLVYYATCEGGSLDAGRVVWRSGGGCGWPISSHGCRAWRLPSRHVVLSRRSCSSASSLVRFGCSSGAVWRRGAAAEV